MNTTTGFWYQLFDMPTIYTSVRTVLLFGKKKMFTEITKAVALQEGETLLDVGSGPGELSQLFQGKYTGIDYSKNYVTYAQKKHPGKQFLQGDVLQLSIPEKSYDVVLLASFIHHFTDAEVTQILRNVTTVAHKRIVILEPCPWRRNPLAWLLLRLDRGAHVRSFEQQKKMIERELQIIQTKTFTSGLYKLSIIIAQPKEH